VSATPTLAAFLRHVDLFGGALVNETASEFLGEEDLARLRVHVDEAERNRRRGRFTVGKRRRRSEAERVLQVHLLHEEGFLASEIASKIGISAERVDRLLRSKPTGATNVSGFAFRAPKSPANQGVKTPGRQGPQATLPGLDPGVGP
jgi:hypothetical protein